MRRLTLILSDLYLPEETGTDGSSAALELPALGELLRFADAADAAPDWRTWLATQIAPPSVAAAPSAQVAACAFLDAGDAARAGFATAVDLSARIDHVRLADRGLLRIPVDEHAAWCTEFAQHFGPRYVLHGGSERSFFLTGPAAPTAGVDPARFLGADVAPALAQGSGAAELRRLGAEIEMWLHGSPLNEVRERHRQPRIGGLWLWGGGAPALPAPSGSAARPDVALYGSDPFLAGLATLTGIAAPAPAPAEFSSLATGAAHAVVEVAPMSGVSRESLANLEQGWFAALQRTLRAGALSAVDIVANGRCFTVPARAHWRFWRARRPWLENLAHRDEIAKA